MVRVYIAHRDFRVEIARMPCITSLDHTGFSAIPILGFVLHIGGGVIHVLGVIAAAVLVYDLVTGKRVAS